MKSFLLAVLFCLSFGYVFSQSPGDYRTRQSGSWNQPSTWEVFNDGAWQLVSSSAAGSFQNVLPSHNSGVITLTHIIEFNYATILTLNQTVIQSGGRLNVRVNRTLRFIEDSQTPLTVSAGGILSVNGTVDLSQLTSSACVINGLLTSNGVVSSPNAARLIFNAGSVYDHVHRSGGNIPLATWNINSLCQIVGLANANPGPIGNLNQSFGNFLWNTHSMGATTSFSLQGQLRTVNGNLTLRSTGTPAQVVRFDNSGPGNSLVVGNNLIIEGGQYTFAQNQTSSASISIGGDFVMSGGAVNLNITNNLPLNIYLNGDFLKTGGVLSGGSGLGRATLRFDGATQSFTSNGAIVGPVHYSIENGSDLDLGTSALTGTGSFTMLNGSTVHVGSLDGLGAIQNNTTNGNIQVGGTRVYQVGSTVVYDGEDTQFMASGHPANSNTILRSENAVYMVGNVTINGSLMHDGVPLVIGANTLTLGGAYFRNNQYFGILASSSLVLNGSGDLDLLLAPVGTAYPINPINNFTINRAGTVLIRRNLAVNGAFNMTNGTLSIGGVDSNDASYELVLRGNVTRTAGTLAIRNNPNLTIEGAGTLPTSFPMVLQTPTSYIGQLTMNRAGSTFNTSAVITLDTLNLFNGVVNNTASNLTVRSGGLIMRRSTGSVNQVLSAQTSYDVAYEVNTDITTGNELPNVVTALRNLMKRGSASVLLNKDIIVNGSFTIEEGEFDVGVNNDVTIRQNFVVNDTFEPRQGLVTFAGGSPQTISGTDTASFYNIAVNQSPVSTLAITTRMMVENNLGINSATVVNAGNDQLRILSGPVRTANVSQLASGAIINGRVIVERYLPKAVQRRHYFHIASPVTNTTLADWNAEVTINQAHQWREDLDAYQQVGLGAAAVSGKGFTVDFRTSVSSRVDSRGTLRQGPISVPVTTQSPGVIEGDDGWNLLGNPYPSAIDWDKVVLPPEIYDAVYVWDNFGNSGQGTEPGQLVSFVDGIGTPLGYDGEIAQGQAFWVKAINNGSLTFTESAKGTFTDANFYRKPEINSVLRINLTGSEVKDEAVVRLRDGATENFDGKYDAYKYLKEGFRISTLTADNVKAVINAFGTSSCDQVVKVAAEEAKAGSYTLGFTGMDSFDASIALSLIDQVENKTIDIRNQPVYAFSVTDENIGSMPTRFLISISSNAPSVNTTILANGEASCEDTSTARVVLDSSEEGVKYSVELNGKKISESVPGTGNKLELEVNTSTLAIGENNVIVRAQSGTCAGAILQATPVITKVKRGEIKSVTDGNVCGQGSVTLRASGAEADGWYQWYESSDALEPINGQQNAEFVTPGLTKSKTYYVSVVNALGCEGERKPVVATVSYPEDEVTLITEGYTLTSSAAEGNQWYLNGELMAEETSNTVEAEKSGLYTVVVANGACKSSASIEMTGAEEAADLIAVFPNPTTDKVYIRVKSKNNNVIATVVNSQGIELGTKGLKGENGFKEAEFDLLPYATGIYNIKILDGHKVTIKKIAKVK